MISDDFFDSLYNFLFSVTVIGKKGFWAQKDNFQLILLYVGGEQTKSLFFLRTWNFKVIRCVCIPQVPELQKNSQFYVLLKFRCASNTVLKKCLISALVWQIFVIKKFEVRDKKKVPQNLCERLSCSKCFSLMFVWCFAH